jgi:hypothetical protein
MWYTDDGGDIVVSAVGTDRVHRDWVHQWNWYWYGVMVHWMHHRDDDGDAIVIISDVPVCRLRPK